MARDVACGVGYRRLNLEVLGEFQEMLQVLLPMLNLTPLLVSEFTEDDEVDSGDRLGSVLHRIAETLRVALEESDKKVVLDSLFRFYGRALVAVVDDLDQSRVETFNSAVACAVKIGLKQGWDNVLEACSALTTLITSDSVVGGMRARRVQVFDFPRVTRITMTPCGPNQENFQDGDERVLACAENDSVSVSLELGDYYMDGLGAEIWPGARYMSLLLSSRIIVTCGSVLELGGGVGLVGVVAGSVATSAEDIVVTDYQSSLFQSIEANSRRNGITRMRPAVLDWADFELPRCSLKDLSEEQIKTWRCRGWEAAKAAGICTDAGVLDVGTVLAADVIYEANHAHILSDTLMWLMSEGQPQQICVTSLTDSMRSGLALFESLLVSKMDELNLNDQYTLEVFSMRDSLGVEEGGIAYQGTLLRIERKEKIKCKQSLV